MSRTQLVAAALLPFLLWGAPELMERKNAFGDRELVIRTRSYEVAVLDPTAIAEISHLGERFSRGGWIQSLKDSRGRELLRRESVFSWHPAWGIAQEFTVKPDLVKECAEFGLVLKLGIGVIRRTNVDSIETLFPWEKRISRAGDELTVGFTQELPAQFMRPCKLTVELVFSDAPGIVLRNRIENTGRTELIVESYLHPFFEPAADHQASAIRLPAAEPKGAISSFTLCELPFELAFRHRALAWAEAVNLKSGGTLRIDCRPAADGIIFWRSQALESFAVEPFCRKIAAPGAVLAWEYVITPR